MSQTDSHDPNQGELSGEVTNRLLMDMPQSPRRAQNRALTVAGVFIFLIAIGGIGFVGYMLWTPEKSGVVYLPNLSYTEYREKMSTKELDPRGASNIYYLREAAPDGAEGYNLWMRMKIPKNSYEAMLRRRRSDLERLDKQGVKVTGKSSSRIEIPPGGNRMALTRLCGGTKSRMFVAPIRDAIPGNIRDAECANGYFWAYDPSLEKLYIWQWEATADGSNRGGTEGKSGANDDSNPDADANPNDGTDPDADSNPDEGTDPDADPGATDSSPANE